MTDQHHKNVASAPSCELVEDRIHELMDLRQPLLSDELVRDHIKDCDQCAELIVDFGALNESLSQIPLETLHRLSGLHVAPESQRQRRVHPVSFVAAIACMLLVCLTSGIWFAPTQDDLIPTRIDMVSTPVLRDSVIGSDAIEESSIPQQLAFAPTFHKTSPPTDFINTVSFERISGGVEPFQNYIDITADLPGIQPVSKSVNATYHIIRSISERPSSDRMNDPAPASKDKGQEPEGGPDVGCHDLLAMQLCCV